MEQFLSIKEATELVGKAESTIKRLVHRIVKDPDHTDRHFIQPPADELENKQAAGEPYAWRLERQFLLRNFPVDPDAKQRSAPAKGDSTSANSFTAPVIEVLREQLQSKDRQIVTLETQLDRKDGQIADLNERMRESNVLMKELQQKLAITGPAVETETDSHSQTVESKQGAVTPVVHRSPVEEKKPSIWTRPIHLFGAKQP